MASTNHKSSETTQNHRIMEAAEYPSAREDPTVYPGARPPRAYLLDGSKVRLIDFVDRADIRSGQVERDDGTLVGLNSRLKELGAVPLEERVAVIGYGSNRNPGQILKKWRDARRQGDAKEQGFDKVQDVVPVLKGTLENIDVAVEQFVNYGTVYAGILESPETKGQSTEVWLTLLDSVQFRIMNESEGIYGSRPHYKLAIFPGYKIEGFSKTISALGYAGNSRIFCSRTHNSPIVFETVLSSGGTRLPQYDAVGALTLILEEGDLTRKLFAATETKNVADLMRWINREWNSDSMRQRSGEVNPSAEYVAIAGTISDYIESSSIDFRLADAKEQMDLIIPTGKAGDAIPEFTLRNLLRNGHPTSR